MKTYFGYLKDVLGVHSLMLDQPVLQSSGDFRPAFFVGPQGDIKSPMEKPIRLLVINFMETPKESFFEPEVQELSEKMLAALKLGPQEFFYVDCVMNEKPLIPAEAQKFFKADAVLFFSKEPENIGQIQIKGGFSWLETFSPAYLLKNPDAKRIVWTDMQKILKELN